MALNWKRHAVNLGGGVNNKNQSSIQHVCRFTCTPKHTCFFYSKLYHSIVEFANLIGQLQITGWYTAFIFYKKKKKKPNHWFNRVFIKTHPFYKFSITGSLHDLFLANMKSYCFVFQVVYSYSNVTIYINVTIKQGQGREENKKWLIL